MESKSGLDGEKIDGETPPPYPCNCVSKCFAGGRYLKPDYRCKGLPSWEPAGPLVTVHDAEDEHPPVVVPAAQVPESARVKQEGAAFRLVPEELKPYMDSNPAVVALVFAYKRGDMDEASMWKALALHQTQAVVVARKIASDTVARGGAPLVYYVDKEGAAHLAAALAKGEVPRGG